MEQIERKYIHSPARKYLESPVGSKAWMNKDTCRGQVRTESKTGSYKTRKQGLIQ